MSREENYYIYFLCDPRRKGPFVYDGEVFPNEPFYVGKGKRKRMYAHVKRVTQKVSQCLDLRSEKERKIAKIIKLGLQVVYGKVKRTFRSVEKALGSKISEGWGKIHKDEVAQIVATRFATRFGWTAAQRTLYLKNKDGLTYEVRKKLGMSTKKWERHPLTELGAKAKIVQQRQTWADKPKEEIVRLNARKHSARYGWSARRAEEYVKEKLAELHTGDQ